MGSRNSGFYSLKLMPKTSRCWFLDNEQTSKSWAKASSFFLKIKNIAIWWDVTQPQHRGFQIQVSPLVHNTTDG